MSLGQDTKKQTFRSFWSKTFYRPDKWWTFSVGYHVDLHSCTVTTSLVKSAFYPSRGGLAASCVIMNQWRAEVNKSPAVARVSRPYSWCTLATCIHNCPSMMFWTCCCLRPKCKRSYLLISITSGIYVNKLCKQVKRPIPPGNTCVANCGQTAAVSDIVTIDSL